mmetsp:Transcript_30115/g.82759  ORF Transcript_30115/g.82759 Transcript_30115/m.82759 type:complete len:203 (+) Transcript_30115:899-1507(+)
MCTNMLRGRDRHPAHLHAHLHRKVPRRWTHRPRLRRRAPPLPRPRGTQRPRRSDAAGGARSHSRRSLNPVCPARPHPPSVDVVRRPPVPPATPAPCSPRPGALPSSPPGHSPDNRFLNPAPLRRPACPSATPACCSTHLGATPASAHTLPPRLKLWSLRELRPRSPWCQPPMSQLRPQKSTRSRVCAAKCCAPNPLGVPARR